MTADKNSELFLTLTLVTKASPVDREGLVLNLLRSSRRLLEILQPVAGAVSGAKAAGV
jgi:hypothetical protein